MGLLTACVQELGLAQHLPCATGTSVPDPAGWGRGEKGRLALSTQQQLLSGRHSESGVITPILHEDVGFKEGASECTVIAGCSGPPLQRRGRSQPSSPPFPPRKSRDFGETPIQGVANEYS